MDTVISYALSSVALPCGRILSYQSPFASNLIHHLKRPTVPPIHSEGIEMIITFKFSSHIEATKPSCNMPNSPSKAMARARSQKATRSSHVRNVAQFQLPYSARRSSLRWVRCGWLEGRFGRLGLGLLYFRPSFARLWVLSEPFHTASARSVLMRPCVPSSVIRCQMVSRTGFEYQYRVPYMVVSKWVE